MKKAVLWIAAGALALALLALLAALVIPRLIDVGKFKPQLETRIAEAVGRPFTLDGALELSLLPRVRLASSGIRMASPDGFEAIPFILIRRIEVRLNPLSLLAGKVVVEWVGIDGLQVCLQRNAAGRGNWEGLVKDSGKGRRGAAPSGGQAGVAASRGLPALTFEVQALDVSDASLIWLDAGPKVRREVSGIGLRVSKQGLDQPVEVVFSLDADGQPLKGDLDLAGGLTEALQADGRIELGDSRIDLAGRMHFGDQPNLTLTVAVDRLNLDRYLPDGSGSGREGEVGRPQGTQAPGDPSAVESGHVGLPDIELTVAVSAAELTLKGVEWRDLRAEVHGSGGAFDLTRFSAALYGGRLEGVGRLDAAAGEVRSRIALTAESVAVGPLVRALDGRDILEGNAGGRLTIATRGMRKHEMMQTLAGSGEVLLTQGMLKGIDLAAMTRVLEGTFAVAPAGEGRTEFTELRVPFRIDKGRVSIEQAALTSPAIAAVASGTADLVTETVDMRIVPQVSVSRTQDGRRRTTDIRVPLRVTGTFDAPVFAPDYKDIALDQLEQRMIESGDLKRLLESGDLAPLEKSARSLLNELFSD